MMQQWPREKQEALRRNSETYLREQSKTQDDFLNFYNKLSEECPLLFARIVDSLRNHDEEMAQSKERCANVCRELNWNNIEIDLPVLITLASAAILADDPSLKMWERIGKLQYHSWEMENWHDKAMLAYVQIKPNSASSYIELSKKVFSALDDMTLKSPFERTNQEREGARAHWIVCTDKLHEIWWWLQRRDTFSMYSDIWRLFRVFSELNIEEFIAHISKSKNPYLVNSALTATGVGEFYPRLDQWKKYALAAPVAFEDDGTWNESVLMPLLLIHAHSELFQYDIPHFDASATEIDAAKHDISQLSEFIADVLALRDDFLPLSSRWSTWLMREILRCSEEDHDKVKSPAFVNNKLIESLGRKLKGKKPIQMVPQDAASWEVWHYRCVLGFHVYDEVIAAPDIDGFLAEWAISFDDWPNDKGRKLQEHAELFFYMTDAIPGRAARLLAYPIILQSESPEFTWVKMWDSAYTLREIIEFGGTDDSQNYESQSRSSNLLLLLFRIGLAILDQRASIFQNDKSSATEPFIILYSSLFAAVLEMQEIDNTINTEKWRIAFRHLAIRRLIWERPSTDTDDRGNLYRIFNADDEPTLNDALKYVRGDSFELVSLLASILLNKPDIEKLKNELRALSIDLSATLSFVRLLNQYHSRKYPIDEAQLRDIEKALFRSNLLV